jgi:hypothetical protein
MSSGIPIIVCSLTRMLLFGADKIKGSQQGERECQEDSRSCEGFCRRKVHPSGYVFTRSFECYALPYSKTDVFQILSSTLRFFDILSK